MTEKKSDFNLSKFVATTLALIVELALACYACHWMADNVNRHTEEAVEKAVGEILTALDRGEQRVVIVEGSAPRQHRSESDTSGAARHSSGILFYVRP